MGYRRLAPKDRYQLEVLFQSDLSIREISKRFGVAPSTISREFKRTSGQYNAEAAQSDADKRQLKRYKTRKKIKAKLQKKIEYRLIKLWSPEQIAADLKCVSHQTIYRFIKTERRELRAHLRILKKQGKDRSKRTWVRAPNPLGKRVFVDERPKIVEKRIRLGDLERDTVLGKTNSTRLLTIVDRRSRLIRLALIKTKSSEAIHKETVRLLKNEKVHTITNDNSTEFAKHEQTAKALNAKVFFSKAYRSWERGTNENLNGLLRQYFPRRTEIGTPTRAQLRKVEMSLNTRPRKCLGWMTPLQVHKQLNTGQVLR
jgi:transposase, IS30 family